MESYNELCLFIGGPADGKRIAIPSVKHHVKYPENEEVTDYWSERMFGEPDTQLRVFLVDGMTTGEALTRMVDRYQPAAPAQPRA